MPGKARLSDGGDVQRTHASDGAGYAVYKLLPPGIQGTMIESNESILRTGLDGILGPSLLR